MSILPMAIISILSSLLSSMSVWADKLSDIRLSLNDIYMATLMTGWMFLLEGLYIKTRLFIILGVIVILFSFMAIRTQLFITPYQFVRGMIPHHSMAVLMSKRLQDKYGNHIVAQLPSQIIESQEQEIRLMKKIEAL
jgi:hypothetical protein